MPFELFLARRYLKAKRRGLFAFLTTAIAVAGVAIGTAALMTTLAVMDGFQSDLREKIIGGQAHVLVYGDVAGEGRAAFESALKERGDVVAWAPFVLGQGLLNCRGRSSGMVLKGVDLEREGEVNALARSLSAGVWELGGSPAGIVLGEELARNIGAWLGDDVTLLSPQSEASYALVPALKRFRVRGILRTGYYEYDSATAYADLAEAASFFKTPGGAGGAGLRLRELDAADSAARALQTRLGHAFSVRSFSQMNRTLFAALKLEKFVMFLVLALIILVAALNIASNLLVLGAEKLRDIGLLRALGATPAQIGRAFLYLGFLIGAIGVASGLALGGALCWLIARYPLVELPADVYYLSRVPVRVEAADVLSVAGCGLALALLAALYPARRASKIDPLEAIRYG